MSIEIVENQFIEENRVEQVRPNSKYSPFIDAFKKVKEGQWVVTEAPKRTGKYGPIDCLRHILSSRKLYADLVTLKDGRIAATPKPSGYIPRGRAGGRTVKPYPKTEHGPIDLSELPKE